MISTRARPTRDFDDHLDGHLEQRVRVAGARTFREAPAGWALLVFGTGYGVYLMTTGGMGVVNGAMVTTLSLVFGSGNVFVGA